MMTLPTEVLPEGFFELLKSKLKSEFTIIDSEYFITKCKDGCVIRFRIDNKRLCLVAEFPFIVTDFRGVHSRYVEVKERKYEIESLTLWVNFVVSIVLRYHSGHYDSYRPSGFNYDKGLYRAKETAG